MASAESTEKIVSLAEGEDSVCSAAPNCKTYCLGPRVRVRKEAFGLLFYDARGPRLTLVRSGEWLDPAFFRGGVSLDEWVQVQLPEIGGRRRREVLARLRGLLLRLEQKGLINETRGDS